jgi:hypothetical protein
VKPLLAVTSLVLALWGPLFVISGLGACGRERLRVGPASLALVVSIVALLVYDGLSGLISAPPAVASFSAVFGLRASRAWLRVIAGIGAGIGAYLIVLALYS